MDLFYPCDESISNASRGRPRDKDSDVFRAPRTGPRLAPPGPWTRAARVGGTKAMRGGARPGPGGSPAPALAGTPTPGDPALGEAGAQGICVSPRPGLLGARGDPAPAHICHRLVCRGASALEAPRARATRGSPRWTSTDPRDASACSPAGRFCRTWGAPQAATKAVPDRSSERSCCGRRAPWRQGQRATLLSQPPAATRRLGVSRPTVQIRVRPFLRMTTRDNASCRVPPVGICPSSASRFTARTRRALTRPGEHTPVSFVCG